MQTRTPVAVFIFNRPDSTRRIFTQIAKAKPGKLLVIADGPRLDLRGEHERVQAARAVVENVDWDCEVLINYSDDNLGCRERVSSGIDWVFKNVDEAIILEDDCLPDLTFFQFCDELLEYYRYDERVGMIGGSNLRSVSGSDRSSYYFSRYGHVWGWASWRRAWQHYDVSASSWPEFRDKGGLNHILCGRAGEVRYWDARFAAVYAGEIDTWDYQWLLTMWTQRMMAVIPSINLISNIGFGADATHTRGTSIFGNLKVGSIEFPLNHPQSVITSEVADNWIGDWMFIPSLMRRCLLKLRAVSRDIYMKLENGFFTQLHGGK